ncbi:MAG: hypothetical protein AAGJ80_08530, partial [Cyanobacteria bacterium J06553_1]
MIQNQDVVTLFSNAQPNLFPTNTAYRFTNRLPHLWRIPQSETWRVGVSEFSTLNTLDTIPLDLTIDVGIDNDPRFTTMRMVERFQFFKSGADDSHALSKQTFEDRVKNMQHYNQNIPPEYQNCQVPWKPFINGLAGVTQQMLSQSGFNTYLLFNKDTNNNVKLGVKHNDTSLSNTRYVLSPALQHLLLLDNPTGIQTLKSFEALKDRYVLSQNGTHCDFWYRIIPYDQIVTHWPGFHSSQAADPFKILQGLSQKYDFFTYEEIKDETSKTVTAKLKFKEVSNSDIVMVEFPENFLKLKDKSITFKLAVSTPQYQITDKSKTAIKDAYPLGKHLKDKSEATETEKFFMTDGSEIQLSRSTSAKVPANYKLSNFKLMAYCGKQPLKQLPYHQILRIPRGNYTMTSFIETMKNAFSKQPTFSFDVKKDKQVNNAIKRIKLEEGEEYRCTLKSLLPGYRITIDPRLQSILAFEHNVLRDKDVETSMRPILLSS